MEDIKFTKELMNKAKEAGSADELLVLAKENEIDMTVEEAEYAYAKLHKSGELADDELDNVAGGCSASSSCPDTCPVCNGTKFEQGEDGGWICSGCESKVLNFRWKF